MAEVWVYADETGDLDLSGAPGTSTYFGFGTATFAGNHGDELWQGLELRCRLERRGLHLPVGFHAKNDSFSTRSEVFDIIAQQTPRFDTTFLYKPNAYPRIRQQRSSYLYKLAWYLHFKTIVEQIAEPDDSVVVIAANLKLKRREQNARDALAEVCAQVASGRDVTLCVWEAPSSWGVQVADYGLWATQRVLEGRNCPWYKTSVLPNLRSAFRPWGQK